MLIIPKLRAEPLRGSATVGRSEGTLRTTPQTSPTVIQRLRLLIFASCVIIWSRVRTDVFLLFQATGQRYFKFCKPSFRCGAITSCGQHGNTATRHYHTTHTALPLTRLQLLLQASPAVGPEASAPIAVENSGAGKMHES